MEAHAGCPPQHVLGYTIRSHTRIYVSYLIPCSLELFVYIAQFVADCAVGYEHFVNRQPNYGWATLSLVLIPPILTFAFVLSSKQQWRNPRHLNRMQFVSYHLLQMILFPFFSIFKYMERIFWSVEALFHDENDEERMLCLEKAEECSTCELYHLIQAYGQSAPQIILQLYHMFTQTLFRNYQTTNAQAICLVFSAIDIAAITTTYQRFESQHEVGRHYPWAPPQEVAAKRKLIEKNQQLIQECECKKRESERTISSFPASDKIMENFKRQQSVDSMNSNLETTIITEPKIHEVQVHSYDEVDNEAVDTSETSKLVNKSVTFNATDDDKIKIFQPKPHLLNIREEQSKLDSIEVIDVIPESPAPTLPPSLITPALCLKTNVSSEMDNTKEKKRVSLSLAGLDPALSNDTPLLRAQTTTATETKNQSRFTRTSRTLSQLETLKNMFIVNAQLYIKEHVPRPPKMLLKNIDDENQGEQSEQIKQSGPLPTTPLTPKDVVDFFLPRPTRIVNGIQQDDFAGKTIAFFGWISFVTMRMLSLATFCVFFPKAFFIIVSCHYVVMLAGLCLESRFKGKLNRTLFYLLLAYVYIFVLMEFRIRFKHIKFWFISYFFITMVENITMTLIWYTREEFESWWFGFIYEAIIYNGILFISTLLVYYIILRPRDVTLIIEDDENDNKKES